MTISESWQVEIVSLSSPTAYAEQVANEWRSRAKALAEWSMRWLVNRADVWGKYTGRTEGKFRAVTAPFKDERGKVQLEQKSIEKHFKATNSRALLGLHSTSSSFTSRWLAIDLDQHDDDEDAQQIASANFVAATRWHGRMQSYGFDPLLLDSNGRGGFHLLLVFAEPMDARAAHEFGLKLTSDFAQLGLDAQPEIFPGKGRRRHYGNWLRLPGRHHTRKHYTRVYNDEPWDDEEKWLVGEAAIERILATRPAPASLLERQGVTRRRPTVCIDFDGVLHSYSSGWQGIGSIPDDPTHGAAKGVAKLRERYRVVVHSSRCRTAEGREAIAKWLKKHRIKVDEICEHKPPALVYLDDRAVRFTGEWDEAVIAINDFRR